ncbi:MAG: bifunctional phosphoribosylaminoimidazolecarboxamide formyltransferase/IMP cyclohydrolase [Defluviitaleaceae bacterium]|nr:bifunctional phosphoribosylaminoimidazolecarboxamide formyltransferase/IMP cyclohydrolase [Defluviitaleaceae bacterium]
MKKRALLHVSDETGIVDFAQFLVMKGYELISTGKTYKILIENKVVVQNMYEFTGFREILDGAMKTLHPNVYGGILVDRENLNHMKEIMEHNIELIDLVVANAYPFEEKIEKISIETTNLIRASAKNHAYITVIVDSNDYYKFISELNEEGAITLETRKKFAAKAFRYTAAYDAIVASYLTEEEYPEKLTLTYDKVRETTYGENPHQTGAIYEETSPKRFVGKALRLKGESPSFNNTNDADLALSLVSEFIKPTCVFVKHLNPIAVASAENFLDAFTSLNEEVKSVFGSVIAFNGVVEEDVAELLVKTNLQLILAPDFTEKSLEILEMNESLIILAIETSYKVSSKKMFGIEGGLLIGEPDADQQLDLNVVTERQPSDEEIDACLYADTIVKYAKSSAVVISDGKKTLGIGTGQASRRKAAILAFAEAKMQANKGGLLEQTPQRFAGAVLASDSFFCELSTIEKAHEAGITCIIQPGDGTNNKEAIEICNKYGIAMILTGIRHFRH